MSMNTLPGYGNCNGYWKLSDATDLSGKSRTLTTAAGTPTYVAPGKFAANGLLIDATEGVAAAGTPFDCKLDFSFGVWYKPTALTSGATYYMMDNRSNVGGSGRSFIVMSIEQSGGVYSFAARASDNTLTKKAFAVSPVGSWHLFGFSGSSVSPFAVNYYVDGAPFMTANAGTVYNANSWTRLGWSTDYNSGQLGTYGTAWSEQAWHDDAWWRRTYAWFTGKLD